MHKITLLHNKLSNINIDITYANDRPYPKLQYGYNHFIFQNIIKFNEKVVNYKEKQYMITEPYYITASPHAGDEIEFDSILTKTLNYYKNIDSKLPSFYNNSICALIEIIHDFKFITTKNPITTLHLTDNGHCNLIKSIICKRLNINKSDKYVVISEKKIIKDPFDEIYSSKIKYNELNEADLITTEINLIDPISALTEQQALPIILKYIVQILHSQKNGGNLILHLYETYTSPTIHIIEFLKTMYETVHLVKPSTSYKVHYEKYLVCENFKKNKISSKLLKDFEQLNTSIDDNKDYFIFKVFENIHLNDDMIQHYISLNQEFEIIKYNGMNNIMSFLQLENYNGHEYFTMLNEQKQKSEEWASKYLI
jgi:23S rRNA U2552 (ribose-2'-O)-methylase RlmE/FtsJ